MAKSSRKAKAVEAPEEVELSQPETGTAPNKEEMFLMGLLIVAFGFILFGILINWYVLYDRYDTPFMMVMQKDPSKTVKQVVYAGKASADKGEESEDAGDGDSTGGGDNSGGGGGDSGGGGGDSGGGGGDSGGGGEDSGDGE